MRWAKVTHRARLLPALALALAAAACTPEPTLVSTQVCLACEHHGVPAPYMTVYHAGGGEAHPGFRQNMLSVYDSLRETGPRNSTCFEGLGPGRHHFAALGYDELIRDSVLGTLQVDIDTRTEPQQLILAVSERH